MTTKIVKVESDCDYLQGTFTLTPEAVTEGIERAGSRQLFEAEVLELAMPSIKRDALRYGWERFRVSRVAWYPGKFTDPETGFVHHFERAVVTVEREP